MEDKIIKQFGVLKSIKLSDSWRKELKERLLIECLEKREKTTYYSLFNFGWLFQPIPRSALVGISIVFVMFSLSFSGSISRENFYGEPIQQSIVMDEWGNNGEIMRKNREMNEEIGKNREIDAGLPLIGFVATDSSANKGGGDNNKEKNNKEIGNEENNKEIETAGGGNDEIAVGGEAKKSYASDNKEITAESFRTNLMERMNRVWVLALESKNNKAFSVAVEAEKFFNDNDLDSALRAVMAAENLLLE